MVWLRLTARVRDTLPGKPVIGVGRNIFWSLPEEHFTFTNFQTFMFLEVTLILYRNTLFNVKIQDFIYGFIFL